MKDLPAEEVAETAIDLFGDLPSDRLYIVAHRLSVQHSRKFIDIASVPNGHQVPKRRNDLFNSAKSRVRELIPSNLVDFFESHVNVSIGSGDDGSLPYVVTFEIFVKDDYEHCEYVTDPYWITLSSKFDETTTMSIACDGWSETQYLRWGKQLMSMLNKAAMEYRNSIWGRMDSGEFIEMMDVSRELALFDYYFVQFGLWISSKEQALFEIGDQLYKEFINEPIIA